MYVTIDPPMIAYREFEISNCTKSSKSIIGTVCCDRLRDGSLIVWVCAEYRIDPHEAKKEKNLFFFPPTDMNKNCSILFQVAFDFTHSLYSSVMISSSISARALHDSTSRLSTNFPLSISNEIQVCYSPATHNENPTQPTA
jgi:hypothetical protein